MRRERRVGPRGALGRLLLLWDGRVLTRQHIRPEEHALRLGRLLELQVDHLEAVDRPGDDEAVLLVVREELVPQRVPAEDPAVADDDEPALRPRQRDVQPAGVRQEPDALVVIRADAAEQDVRLLAALEGVHRADLDRLVHVRGQRAVPHEVVDDVPPLALVGRDDPHLARQNAEGQQLVHEQRDDRRLLAVEVRGAAPAELLLGAVVVEKHRPGRVRPHEEMLLPEAVRARDAVGQRALVKAVRREGRDRRVHSVLDLQAVRPDAEEHQPLEERAAETRGDRLLAEDDGAELAVVADEDELLRAVDERDERLGLARLRALVDEHVLQAEREEAAVAGGHARRADHVRGGQNLVLHLPEQRVVLALVAGAEGAALLLELAELDESRRFVVRNVDLSRFGELLKALFALPVFSPPLGLPPRHFGFRWFLGALRFRARSDPFGEHLNLVVQREGLDRGRVPGRDPALLDVLPRLRAEPHNFEPSGRDALREVVDRDVGGRGHQNLNVVVNLDQVVDERGGCDCLAGARRPLDQRDRLRGRERVAENAADGGGLRVVQAGEAARRRELQRHLGVVRGLARALRREGRVDGVPEQPVVQERGQARLVPREYLQRVPHAVEAHALPDELAVEAGRRPAEDRRHRRVRVRRLLLRALLRAQPDLEGDLVLGAGGREHEADDGADHAVRRLPARPPRGDVVLDADAAVLVAADDPVAVRADPRRLDVVAVDDLHLVADDEVAVAVDAREVELPEPPPAEAGRPRDARVAQHVLLLHLLVGLGLELEERQEGRLVGEGVLVEEVDRLDRLRGVRLAGEKQAADAVEDALALLPEDVLDGRPRARLPHVLELDDLLRRDGHDGRRAVALGVREARRPDEPREELPVLDQREPRRGVPAAAVPAVARADVHAGVAAEQDHDGVRVRGHEAEDEDVLAAADEALEDGFGAEEAVGVQRDLLVLAADHVVQDVRGGGAPAAVAEPLAAALHGALHDAVRLVAAAVRAGVRWEGDGGLLVVELLLLLEVGAGVQVVGVGHGGQRRVSRGEREDAGELLRDAVEVGEDLGGRGGVLHWVVVEIG